MILLGLLLGINLMLIFFFTRKEINFGSTIVWSWIIQILLAILYLGDDYYNYYGVIYINIFLMVLLMAYFISRSFSTSVLGSRQFLSIKILRNEIIILFLVYIVYILLQIYIKGYTLENIFSFDKLLIMSHDNAVDRYSGEGNGIPSYINVLFLSIGQILPCLSGLYSGLIDKKKFLIILLGFLPGISAIVMDNVKATIIACVIMWGVFFLIGVKIRRGKYPDFNWKVFLTFSIGGAVLFLLFIVSFMFRIGIWDLDSYTLILNKMVSYSFGHIPAFDNWFLDNIIWIPQSFGKQTFLGVLQGLGLVNREIGLYDDYYYYGLISTNVYTYFRGILLDFGILGSLFYGLILASIAGYMERFIKRGSPFAITILASLWIFFLYYIASIFVYVSYMITFFAIYCLLKYCYVNKDAECENNDD